MSDNKTRSTNSKIFILYTNKETYYLTEDGLEKPKLSKQRPKQLPDSEDGSWS